MLVPKVPVAREGYPFIGFAAFLTVVLAILDYSGLAVLGVAATAFILYFFRDPERFLPEKADALVSPADGKIIVIEEVADQSFTGGQALAGNDRPCSTGRHFFNNFDFTDYVGTIFQ